MKALETTLLTFLQRDHQIAVPVFQRRYCWNLRQQEAFWNDLIGISGVQSHKTHFLGSIYHVNQSQKTDTIPQISLIDGQQRLITATTLLMALYHKQKTEGTNFIKPIEMALMYIDNKKKKQHKFILHNEDSETFKALMMGHSLSETPSRHLLNAYNYFKMRLNNANISAADIISALNRFVLIEIELNSDLDEPQLIFETLNSAGLQLTQSDLIRNHLLINLSSEEQTQVYSSFWLPIKNMINRIPHQSLDAFLRCWLIIYHRNYFSIDDTYHKFKLYFESYEEQFTTKDIFENIYRYAEVYFLILQDSVNNDIVKKAINSVLNLNINDSLPLLTKLIYEYMNTTLDAQDLYRVIRLLDDYIQACIMNGISHRLMIRTFESLLNVESLESYIFILTEAIPRISHDMETEIKFRVSSFDDYRSTLRHRMGASLIKQVFEENVLFDSNEGFLADHDSILRIRTIIQLDDIYPSQNRNSDIVITFKGPAIRERIKSREDIDLLVIPETASNVEELFNALGFFRYISYERKRESWKYGECDVMFDEVPFIGFFVEIEGPSTESIETTAKLLELLEEECVTVSYANMLKNEYGCFEARFRDDVSTSIIRG